MYIEISIIIYQIRHETQTISTYQYFLTVSVICITEKDKLIELHDYLAWGDATYCYSYHFDLTNNVIWYCIGLRYATAYLNINNLRLKYLYSRIFLGFLVLVNQNYVSLKIYFTPKKWNHNIVETLLKCNC